ncbi:ABC transporter ATP-binding protein/permease [Hyphomicrobiales bacterium FT118]|uniref:ABC transporter ATP-binding protein/permease n=2 Tax=Futiania mangrovi TaxID=2959716 RepID=A0A9J6PG81_9PROT|nr:ABC transporter ATP-binding protein/permease [Futiania mangrovii]MCP1335615.1 ABC transporter ATP-binding protein/permease [Futiania mangrovii]
MGVVRDVLPYLWPKDDPGLRARVVLSLVSLALAKALTVVVPYFYKGAVDALDTGTGTALGIAAAPVFMILAYAVARILNQAFAQARDAIFARVGQRALRRLALRTFRHVHSLSLRFHLTRRTGGLSRIIERGTKGVDFLLRFMLFSVIPTLIEIGLVVAVFWVHFGGLYAVVLLVTVALYVVFTYVVNEWRARFRRQLNETDTDANTKAVDSLLNYETVKYFGNEEREAARYDRAMAGYEEAAVRTQMSLAALNLGQGAIIAVGLAIIMLMVASGVQEGRFTIGDFVLANTFLIQLYMPLNFLGTVFREIKQSLIDMETMFTLLGEPVEVVDRPDARTFTPGPGEVRFEGVSFAYDPDRPILKDVSFTIPAGRTVALVGPSGGGKSTIARLLFRFYDTGAGCIAIDGQDIREVTQASLRAGLGVVPQDTVLFNDTIGYNIRYGRLDATDAEVEAAAAQAQIHDFVSRLPKGYATEVGERGLKLSGGEKQRVAIARTILKDPCVLILDEATSALDVDTEREIQSALGAVSRGRTTLVIAHRLSTVVDADEILVIADGRIEERGTHAALLARKGRYAAMWSRQRAAAEARAVLAEAGEGSRSHPAALDDPA